MAFPELFASIRACQGAPYCLAPNPWRAIPGEPKENQAEQLVHLAEDLERSGESNPLPVDALDQLDEGLKKLTLVPKVNGLISLISSSLVTTETKGYKKFLEAKERHTDGAKFLDKEQSTRALEHLVRRNELLRFARVFRALYLPNPPLEDRRDYDAALHEVVEEVAKRHKECFWLQRARSDFDWPCTLVPNEALAPFIKELDLKDCRNEQAIEVIEAHVRRKFATFKIVLNCSQPDLYQLIFRGALNSAQELDLRACPQLDWAVMQPHFAKLKTLKSLLLPADLQVPQRLVWDSAWERQLITNLTQSLKLIAHNQVAQDKLPMQVPVSFMVQDAARLRALPILQRFSASGIQAATIETLMSLRFRDNCCSLILNYCPKVTKEGFCQLFEKYSVKSCYLVGCSQVDDSYFVDHPLLREGAKSFTGVLDLTVTRVTLDTINKLTRAHPKANIIWDIRYLYRLQETKKAFGMDRQGLSDVALEALLHLKYTGCFPLVSVECAMELLTHTLAMIKNREVVQELKEYCRFILELNVSRQNVRRLYHFARQEGAASLLYLCQVFIHTFYSAENPQQTSLLTAEEKVDFEMISKAPLVASCDFSSSEEIFYVSYTPENIEFSVPAAPLYDQVRSHNIYYFCERYASSDPHLRAEHLTWLCQEFPDCRWLQALALHPQRIERLITHSEADLRGLEVSTAIVILKAFHQQKLQLILDCTRPDFLAIMDAIDKRCITLLDLRDILRLSWEKIEPYLLEMPALTYYLLPSTFKQTNSAPPMPTRMTGEWNFFSRLNILHNFRQDRELFAHVRKTCWPATLSAMRAADYAELLDTKVNFTTLSFTNFTTFTKDEFQQALAILRSPELSLFGSRNVDDSFIPEQLPEQLKKLDLRGTQVSREKVEALRRRGIVVSYDAEYLPSLASWHKICKTSSTTLSQEVFEALCYFNCTGYFPLLTERLAMELILCNDERIPRNWRLQLLKKHCLQFLALNISRENVQACYRFAKKINNPFLRYLTYYFVEVHYNPYNQSGLSSEERAFFHWHCRQKREPLYDDTRVFFQLEKLKTLPLLNQPLANTTIPEGEEDLAFGL